MRVIQIVAPEMLFVAGRGMVGHLMNHHETKKKKNRMKWNSIYQASLSICAALALSVQIESHLTHLQHNAKH